MNDVSAQPQAAANEPDPQGPIIEVSAPLETDQRKRGHLPITALYLEHKLWTNPRRFSGLEDEKLARLAESIRHHTIQDAETQVTYVGIKEELLVVPVYSNGDVIYLVLDGQRRYLAAQLLYKNQLGEDVLVPVVYREPEPVELTPELASQYLLESLETVGTREGLSGMELAENARRLRDSKDPETGKPFSLLKIGLAIDRSESWVSRMLTAMEHATPKLLLSWRNGEVTDEMFRDLATRRDPEKQKEATNAAIEARKSGDKAASRTLAKEQKEIARATKPEPPPKKSAPKADKPESKETRASKAQAPLPLAAPAPKKPERKPPSFAVVEDFLSMADKRPPTHDYVKGLMDGARWGAGLLDPAKFGKAWHTYARLVAGAKPKAKKEKGKRAKKR